MNKQEALSAIRWDVSGFAVGLLLGAVAFWLVRPKNKAASALDMARRWLSWGVFAGFTSGTMFFFRHYEQGGIIGAVIGILFWSGLSWFLGFVWGLIRFGGVRPSTEKSLPSQAGEPVGKSSSWFPIGAAVVAALLLGLVGFSGFKATTDGKRPSTSSLAPEDITAGYIAEGHNQLDLVRVTQDAQSGVPKAQYLYGMYLLLGSPQWLSPVPPGPYRPWGLGLFGEPQALRGSSAMSKSDATKQEAFKFLNAAAEQGYALAQVALYECYLGGIGVPPDAAKAFYWVKRAAASGSVEGRFALAFAPDQSDEAKFFLLSQNALAGHPAAQRFVSQLHRQAVNGTSRRLLGARFGKLEDNPFGSHSYFPDPKDVTRLPALSVSMDYANTNYTTEADAIDLQHPEDKVAKQLIRAAAAQDYPPGQLEAAFMFMDNPATQQEALANLSAAAESGYFPAIEELFLIYGRDDYPFKDDVKALTWGYVVQDGDYAPKMPASGEQSQIAAVIEKNFRSFRSRIENLEAALTAEERGVARKAAREIQRSITDQASVWSQVSRHSFSAL